MPQNCLTELYSFQIIPGGDRAHIPLRLNEFKEIKRNSRSYTENLDQYIQAFLEDSQNFELSWKDVMVFYLRPSFSW
jgi:hypothetical protein